MTAAQAAAQSLLARLAAADEKAVTAPLRGPFVHVVYGGAHLFDEGTVAKVGRLAKKSFETYAPDAETFADALGIDRSVAPAVFERVAAKLGSRPVEDYRIDFEDGYGLRSDEEEDAHAESAARALCASVASGLQSSALGIRVKALSGDTRVRSIRTLQRFMGTLVERFAAGSVDKAAVFSDFVVTLPKVRTPDEVAAFVELLAAFEVDLALPDKTLAVELMIETPESLVDARGGIAVPALVHAAAGRCTALHIGSYDLTASLGVFGSHQSLGHAYCDFAKAILKLSCGPSLALSDGATTTLPVEPHRARGGSGTRALTPEELSANRSAIHGAWRVHADNVRHGLRGGFVQGWDLHPAQIPARYGALVAFFLTALPDMTARLTAFRAEAERATRVGQVFDDKASARGLETFFAVGRACGALREEDSVW